jgi:hypothetical protein
MHDRGSTGGDRIRRHIRSNLVGYLALAVALSMAPVYANHLNVKTSDIRSGAVTARKIGKGAVTRPKIKNGAVTGAKVRNDSLTGTDGDGEVGEQPRLGDEVRLERQQQPDIGLRRHQLQRRQQSGQSPRRRSPGQSAIGFAWSVLRGRGPLSMVK